MTWLFFWFFIVLTIAIVFFPRKAVQNKWLQIFRVLFPSWRFFEKIGYRHSVMIKIRPQGEEKSDDLKDSWYLIQYPVRRSPWIFLLNPHGNLRWAMENVFEHFLSDILELQAKTDWEVEYNKNVQNLTTHQLILNSILYTLNKEQLSLLRKIGTFDLQTKGLVPLNMQFKIVSRLQGRALTQGEDQFISSEIPLYIENSKVIRTLK